MSYVYERERRLLEDLRLATVAEYPWINWPIILKTTRTKDALPGIGCCVHCVHSGLCAEKRMLPMWELFAVSLRSRYGTTPLQSTFTSSSSSSSGHF